MVRQLGTGISGVFGRLGRFLMLYSAAGGNVSPWADRQIFRFGIGLCLLFVCALIDVRHFMRYAYVAYAVSLALLIGVELKGEIGMGAQRWIDLGFFRLQPSELMKIAMILTLARYFHGADFDEVRSLSFLFVPVVLVAVPVLLVLGSRILGRHCCWLWEPALCCLWPGCGRGFLHLPGSRRWRLFRSPGVFCGTIKKTAF